MNMKRLRVILVFLLVSLVQVLYAQKCEHIVQRGEDFESIASKYGVTVEELKKANGESASCYIGRKLQIPYHGVEVSRKPIKVEPYDYQLTSSPEKGVLTKSAATTYQVGYANWKKGKFDTAYLYLQSAAEQGEARAYYPLGDCYTQSSCVGHDEKTAAKWFEKAVAEVKDKSDQNYWLSCLRLADAYVNAKGVEKDVSQARHYYNLYSKYANGKQGSEAVKISNELKAQEAAIDKASSEPITDVASVKNEQQDTPHVANNKDKSVEIKDMFNEACNIPDGQAQLKVDKFKAVINADPYNSYGCTALSYNNIGVIYAANNYLQDARTCYENALTLDPTLSVARNNLVNLKRSQRANRWNAIGNALGALANTLGAMNGTNYNGSDSPTYNRGGTSTSGSTCSSCNGTGKCSSSSGSADRYYCHGSGKCQYCHGSGSKTGYGHKMDCNSCDSSKRGACHYCHGTGICSRCNGTGRK